MSSISVSEARGSMVQAQNVMRLLEKACATLRFMGTIEFGDPTQPGSRDGYILLFIPKEKSNGKFGTRFLTITERDNLFEDIYACIIVRVNEAGGIDYNFMDSADLSRLDKETIIEMNNIKTTSSKADSAEQHFWFLQRILTVGGIFRI